MTRRLRNFLYYHLTQLSNFLTNNKHMSKGKPLFEVELVNLDEDEVYLIMGISEERSDEIAMLCKDSYENKRYFTDTIKHVIGEMENVNEVVFATLCLARIHDKKDDMHAKLELLQTLLKLGKK